MQEDLNGQNQLFKQRFTPIFTSLCAVGVLLTSAALLLLRNDEDGLTHHIRRRTSDIEHIEGSKSSSCVKEVVLPPAPEMRDESERNREAHWFVDWAALAFNEPRIRSVPFNQGDRGPDGGVYINNYDKRNPHMAKFAGPDYGFAAWPGAGLEFRPTTQKMMEASLEAPKYETVGWYGNIDSPLPDVSSLQLYTPKIHTHAHSSFRASIDLPHNSLETLHRPLNTRLDPC